jgi:hypothetical protein
MTRLTIVSILFLVLSAAANAGALRVIGQPQGSYELMLGEVSLPGTSGGSVIFKACSDCRTTAMRVTNTTIYEVDGQVVDLKEFNKAAKNFRGKRGGAVDTAVYLFYSVDSRLVVRLALDSF